MTLATAAEGWSIERVAVEAGVSTSTIKDWIRRGLIPPPVQISPVCRRWEPATIKPALESIARNRHQ